MSKLTDKSYPPAFYLSDPDFETAKRLLEIDEKDVNGVTCIEYQDFHLVKASTLPKLTEQ